MKIIPFDFEYWMNLQKENPKKFKQERVEFIKKNIEATTSNPAKQWNMRKMQLEIDKELKKHPLSINRAEQLLTMSLLSVEESSQQFIKLVKLTKKSIL